MEDMSLREPLSSPSRPACRRRKSTQAKFTLILIIFQTVLIVLFLALADYGDHSLPLWTPQDAGAQATANGSNKTAQKMTESERAKNDISIYYPSK